MSGFDAGWLALREPADHVSRNAEITARVRGHFADRSSLTVVDLGCGTGSNLRGLAASLPRSQHWHLIDGDPDLLAHARRRLADWADGASPTRSGLRLHKGDCQIDVGFECADLRRRDLVFEDVGAELVTAAALFDLVSRDWLERLVAALATRRVPLYAVLNYDGVARWRPEEPRDARVVAAFNRHQRGDKGFGPALGPAASEVLMQVLSRHGYSAWSGESPWRLTSRDSGLVVALAAGYALAAGEIDPAWREALADWGSAHRQAEAVTIGHRDIFASR